MSDELDDGKWPEVMLRRAAREMKSSEMVLGALWEIFDAGWNGMIWFKHRGLPMSLWAYVARERIIALEAELATRPKYVRVIELTPDYGWANTREELGL